MRRTGCLFALLAQAMVVHAQATDPAVKAQLDEAVNKGDALQKKSDYAGALERYRWCASFGRANGVEKAVGTCEQLVGGVERLQGNYPDAETHYREALDHAEKAGDQGRYSAVLNNLANLFGAQGRYAEAIAMLLRCLEIDRREGIKDDAPPYQNLAISYALQGDYARALESFLSALRIYERVGPKEKIALVHHNMGVLQMKQGNYPAAKRELLEALKLGEEAGDQYVTVQAQGDLGRVLELEGHPEEAIAMFRKELAHCTKSGFKVCIGESEMHIGNFHLARLELNEAAEAFTRAREVFEPLHDSYNTGETLRGLGYVAHLRGDFVAAKEYAEKAVALSKQIGDPDGEWQAHALEGLVAKDSKDSAGARTAYGEAIRIIESQRGKVGGGDAEQQRFFEKAVYPYQQLALIDAADRQPLAALRWAESARARVLRDMLAGDPERVRRAMTEAESAEETKFLATFAGLNARAARAPAAEKASLAVRQEEVWGNYEAFRGELYVRHPELRTWRGEAPVVTEGEIGALLPDAQTAIVEFVCAKDETLLLVATRGADAAHPAIAAYPISMSREEIGKRSAAFRALLERRDPGFRAEAKELYRRLLEPAHLALRGKTKIQLVADGPLWNLPFQALVDGAGKYWVEQVTMAWAPSLTFLRDQARIGRSSAGAVGLLAFGDPAAPGAAAVPLLREQVAQIAALYPKGSVVRTGAAADEATFRQFAPDAKVIHLASHGIADSENAMRSRLLLAPSAASASGEGGSSRDGWLEAWELMGLDLKADVAVLSACETGRGRVADGEGLVGLTWALFASGVRSAVVSQWQVESQSTTLLMTGLHRRLRAGDAPAAALQGAILATMKDPRYRHPFYWGAFVSAGRL